MMHHHNNHDNSIVAEAPPQDIAGLGLFPSNYPSNAPEFELGPKKVHTEETQDLYELERAEATPRTSMLGADPLSPRQQTARRTSGRRPLSIISNSSINSDLSPPSDDRSSELFSPSRHRRHRSVIGAAVDYRHHHNSMPPGSYYYGNHYGNQYGNPYPYSNPFQSPQTPMAYYANGGGGNNNSSSSSGGGMHSSGNHGAPLFAGYGPSPDTFILNGMNRLMTGGSNGSGSQSPDSPMVSEIPAALSVAAAAAATSNGIQDIFVALAYKERQVIEAKQLWEAAKEDLESFRRQLDSMLSPEPEPLKLPLMKPSIISRRPVPNIGINSVQYVPISHSTPRRPAPRVQVWRIDCEVPSPAQPVDLDDFTDIDELLDREYANDQRRNERGSIAFAIVNCLLDIVNCIISTLPVHQRDFKHRAVYWTPKYPMPMDAFFGHLA